MPDTTDDDRLREIEDACDRHDEIWQTDTIGTLRSLTARVRKAEAELAISKSIMGDLSKQRDEFDGYDLCDLSQAQAICAMAGLVGFSVELIACSLRCARLAELDRIGKLDVLDLQQQLAASRTDVERLNQMLREAGHGQGQIDAYAVQCEEMESLRDWKQSAMDVLGEWEQVWESLGSPGRLGRSKAQNSKAEVESMRADAERWRWIRDLLEFHLLGYSSPDYLVNATATRWRIQTIAEVDFESPSPNEPESIDAAIDAARQQEQPHDHAAQ